MNNNLNRIRNIFDTMFLLEDLRELHRISVPGEEYDKAHEEKFQSILAELRRAIQRIEENKSSSSSKYIVDNLELRSREEKYINLNPIQAGGRLTPEARKALISYGDGYSICDLCLKPFRLDKIQKPPVEKFHRDLAEFLNMDHVRVIPGARRGFQTVTSALVKKGDAVIVSALAHYTEFLAVEQARGVVKEVPLNENNIITAEATAEKIEAVKSRTGKLPVLIMIDHFDYMFGNEHDVHGIGKIAREYDIPLLYNGAYTIGLMPVDGRSIGADFLVGSGHKSMAAVAPSGVLATTDEWAGKIFHTSTMVGDVTDRNFSVKEVGLLGCTLMGGTLLSMMASFPAVRERTEHWAEEVKKSNYFIDEFLKIDGNTILSEMPRKHTLTKVDTTESFNKVAETHKKRGYFLTNELKKRGIVGIFPGATRQWKLNTYGLTWAQVKHVAESFKDLARAHNLQTA